MRKNTGQFNRERGKLGGIKGGPARAAALSPERRSEIARAAALARWGESEAQDKPKRPS